MTECHSLERLKYLKESNGQVNLLLLLLCIILKDFALLPSRDVQILKNLNKQKESEEPESVLEIWLNTLTSLEYQDEQMYRAICSGDVNRIYYLKRFLFETFCCFVDIEKVLGTLAECFFDLNEKSKATPKITKYFDFLML